MSEQDLIEGVSRRYKAMPRAARIAEIRELASRSAADSRFIRRTFPDLYEEAFKKPRRRRSAGVRSVASPRKRQAAKRR